MVGSLIKFLSEQLQLFLCLLVCLLTIIATNFVNVGSKSIFEGDPVQYLKGIFTIMAGSGNANSTWTPFKICVFPLSLLQIYLEVPVKLKKRIQENACKALSVFVIMVDVQV